MRVSADMSFARENGNQTCQHVSVQAKCHGACFRRSKCALRAPYPYRKTLEATSTNPPRGPRLVPTGAEIIPVDDLVRVRVTNASKSMVSLALFPPKDPHDALLFVRDSFEDFSFVNERNRLVQQGAMEEKLCLAYYHGRTKL